MSVQDLSKMGAANVALFVDEQGQRVIEKYPVSDIEYAFYHHAAQRLNAAKIASPKLLFADPARRLLRLEYIPHPVSQDTVAGDETLAMLARLHRFSPDASWRYHTHTWSVYALEKSLALLALPEQASQQLRRFQQSSEVLFRQVGLLSGDSNAGNWGRRDNGELVLFDWERFSMGSPAIDLAPLIKGMGTTNAFQALAERYCRIADHAAPRELGREIAIAKAWIVTEVVTLLAARQKTDLPRYLEWYRENLPGWLASTVTLL
ncbi:phosphotransferase [Kosakonia sacchari]|nr:phosphotransferase [Kosakonia sacchari]AHJ73658.1 aminoglycoside phosphotransferase [Kosakonia sacchari SP1]NUL36391.1 phosphotransferase [Kosakonia sacchari]